MVRLRYLGYVALAALRQSHENLRAVTEARLAPAVDAGVAVSRSRVSGATFGQPSTTFSPFTLYNALVMVSYSLDFFGGARRELEALRSQVDLQSYLLTGADITITANIVTAAVRDASLRATIRATREIAETEEQQLDIIEKQFKVGAVAMTDVLAQRTQPAQTSAQIPPLEKDAAQNRHLLAVLAGKLPSEASSLPEFSLEGFALPADLPVSLPSSLVRQRPDILASESVLHTASAQIGVATANLYLQLWFGSDQVKHGPGHHDGDRDRHAVHPVRGAVNISDARGRACERSPFGRQHSWSGRQY